MIFISLLREKDPRPVFIDKFHQPIPAITNPLQTGTEEQIFLSRFNIMWMLVWVYTKDTLTQPAFTAQV